MTVFNVSAFGIQRKIMERVQGNKRYVVLKHVKYEKEVRWM